MGAVKSTRDDQLERKLQLYLGSQKDWLSIYADWCAANDVGSEGQEYDHHHVTLFVKQQKGKP